ncbi:hypothetical protein GCM10023192_56270 [Amycolatopsis samaneae]
MVLDRPSYHPQDLVRATATVVNAGTGPATAVRLSSSGNLTNHDWDGFTGREVTLAPGQSAMGAALAWVADVSEGVVRLTVTVGSAEPDANPANNTVTVTAALIVVRGGFTGVAYGDRNWNHTLDPGEALAGLRVLASGGPLGFYETVTDHEGRFAFHDLLAGTWSVYVDNHDWIFTGATVEVDDTHVPDVALRGEYDTTGWLAGSARFAAPTYARGDIARMAITLTNSGRGSVPGLTARCLVSNGGPVDAGELDSSGPGATLPAASSRTFQLTVPVDASAANDGYLELSCWVWQAAGHGGVVTVTATARVPGARASKVVGLLLTPVPSPCGCWPRYDPVPSVKVYLRNQVSGQIVARAVTDTNGLFVFYDLPADRYDLGLIGPWRGHYGRTPVFLVHGGDDGSRPPYTVIVEPGPYQPDPEPAPSPPPGRGAEPPAPAPVRPAHDVVPAPAVLTQPQPLATTGVSVGWLALGGLLTFVTGVALLLGSRRRTS